MSSQQQKDKKNRIMAALYTAGVHTAIFFLMFFIIAWRVPNPPFPSGSGIELNFGLDSQGSGDIQPEEPVGTANAQPEQKTEESQPEQEKVTETKEETPVEKPETKPVVTKSQTEELVTSHEESPVVVKEKKEETKKPVEQKEKIEEKPKVEEKPLAVYKPAGKTEDKLNAVGKEGKPGNQGDDKDKIGDKGNPQGNPDSKAMYGNPGTGNGGNGGSGGGSSLELNGWNWDNIPKPNIPDNETGRIVFEIEVDDNGELIKYVKLNSTVSAAAERACIAAIDRLTFTKKSDSKVPAVSRGRITFVIRAQ